MTRNSLLTSTAMTALILAYPALAADMPTKTHPAMPVKAPPVPPPVLSWAGLYGGVNAGYAWAHSSTSCAFLPGANSPCARFEFPNTAPKGGLVGGEIGYNWQYQNWVFGLAGDASWLNVHDKLYFPSVDPGKTDALATRYDWLGTARARAGFAAGPLLLYGTGGAAFSGVKHEYDYNIFRNSAASPKSFSSADTLAGWTVGGGAEWMVDRNWSLKVEYLHVDLGKSNLDISGLRSTPPGTSVLHFTNTMEVLRGGVNFRF